MSQSWIFYSMAQWPALVILSLSAVNKDFHTNTHMHTHSCIPKCHPYPPPQHRHTHTVYEWVGLKGRGMGLRGDHCPDVPPPIKWCCISKVHISCNTKDTLPTWIAFSPLYPTHPHTITPTCLNRFPPPAPGLPMQMDASTAGKDQFDLHFAFSHLPLIWISSLFLFSMATTVTSSTGSTNPKALFSTINSHMITLPHHSHLKSANHSFPTSKQK